MDDAITNTFSSFQESMKLDQDLREEIKLNVRDIEQAAREVLSTLQVIHHKDGLNQIQATCDKANLQMNSVIQSFDHLKARISVQIYYKYYEHWRFVIQRCCFIVALMHYLESETLISLDAVAEKLHIETDRNKGFHLDLEDYLMGLLILANELVRFAVNSVTFGDFGRPIKISKLITQLNSGFRLLNLKNDSLRKKFDALKYDTKKIEEVVYDLSIRGLKSS